MDMSELVDKYGKNLKDIYGEEVLNSNTVDGFMYGVPNQIERGSIPAVFMRKDLVEKYNIDTSAIKEPKDMESVFETVKAGETDMTMLFSINEGDTPATRLFGGDPLSYANYLGVLMDQENDTTITNFFASDWYKETTSMLYDWYQKGYISKDAGTDTENWRTVCKAGNLFSLFLPIIREHLWNLKAQQDMTLKSFRSGIIPSKTARPTTALSTPLHRIQRTRRRPWKPLITSMAARRS